jgi:Phosphodiester glycosidase
MAGGAEVDRILLARIDPAHFKFQVRNRPSGDWDSLDWIKELGAVLVINGSYFTRYGTPATPLVSAGVLSGPESYDAKHGAFVVSPSFVGIRDLAKLDWREAFRGADHGVVSYPLLIEADGQSRSKGNARWLANRTFLAQDGNGRIVLGTTVDAFFSLDRLAAFLRAAPLDLKLALNLDGGPIACQAIVLKDFKRDFCGQWETATDDGGEFRLLKPLFGPRRWGLPIVLAVTPR